MKTSKKKSYRPTKIWYYKYMPDSYKSPIFILFKEIYNKPTYYLEKNDPDQIKHIKQRRKK